jgi:hypothetical protein
MMAHKHPGMNRQAEFIGRLLQPVRISGQILFQIKTNLPVVSALNVAAHPVYINAAASPRLTPESQNYSPTPYSDNLDLTPIVK